MPGEAVTLHGSSIAGGAVVDGKVQRHHTVRTVNVMVGVREIAGLRVCTAVPLVALARHSIELIR